MICKKIGLYLTFMVCSVKKSNNDVFTLFQSKAASLLEQEASLEPASRLKSLRDRVTLTRFDQVIHLLTMANFFSILLLHNFV